VVPLTLVAPSGAKLAWAGTGKVITAKRGLSAIRAQGLPGELLLFLFGLDAADVEITGPPEAIEALKRTRFRM